MSTAVTTPARTRARSVQGPVATRHRGQAIHADPSRVIARPFIQSPERTLTVVTLVAALDPVQASQDVLNLLDEFGPRHENLADTWARHANAAFADLPDVPDLTMHQQLLVGALLTAEYAVEGAALCNPSVVPHPDQDGLLPGQARVALSLRAIGEGHVSVVEFATALVGPGETWVFEPRTGPLIGSTEYPQGFPASVGIAQQVLQPTMAEESNGMEDARFVQFHAPDGTVEYRATYTAYDGTHISPRLMTTPDLRTFRSEPMSGPAVTNKGMALFPRTVGELHYALCRTDGVRSFIASSVDGLVWGEPVLLDEPAELWQAVQVGNCGSPIETPVGWLVMTHGVGPMRRYAIGALLLDLDDPTKVLAHLDRPLLTPEPDEREGYVPNVIYSCGAFVNGDTLWIPYGIGDARIGVASVPLTELCDALDAGVGATADAAWKAETRSPVSAVPAAA